MIINGLGIFILVSHSNKMWLIILCITYLNYCELGDPKDVAWRNTWSWWKQKKLRKYFLQRDHLVRRLIALELQRYSICLAMIAFSKSFNSKSLSIISMTSALLSTGFFALLFLGATQFSTNSQTSCTNWTVDLSLSISEIWRSLSTINCLSDSHSKCVRINPLRGGVILKVTRRLPFV